MQHSSRELAKLSKKELILLLQEKATVTTDILSIPAHIFNETLGSFESICKYLKENKKLSYKQIATHTNRNERTIWATYNNAQKKHSKPFKEQQSSISIPLSHIKNRTYSVLEHIVSYLKEQQHLTLHTIAELLKRNDRTIWTTYHRFKKKREKHE